MALNAYLDVMADIYKLPVEGRDLWKQAVKKSPKLRHRYKCSESHLCEIAKISNLPVWRRMCEYNQMYKCIDDLAKEEPLMFSFDEFELN